MRPQGRSLPPRPTTSDTVGRLGRWSRSTSMPGGLSRACWSGRSKIGRASCRERVWIAGVVGCLKKKVGSTWLGYEAELPDAARALRLPEVLEPEGRPRGRGVVV